MPVVVAVTFTWLGMVLAISFLEAPLKFRAPGVTVALGLGIGRLVFRALNAVEVVALVAVAVALVLAGPGAPAPVVGAAAAGVALLAQLALVRPALSRRADAVLAGAGPSAADAPRSRAHLAYIVLEVLKVVALVVLGVAASA